MLGRNIIGRVDIIQGETIWELKCAKQLEPVHYIQLIVYGWLYQQKYGETKLLKVFNILTEEIVRIEMTGTLSEVVQYLITKKYGTQRQTLNDKEFLASVLGSPSRQESLTKPSVKPPKSKCLRLIIQ